MVYYPRCQLWNSDGAAAKITAVHDLSPNSAALAAYERVIGHLKGMGFK